MRNKRCECCRKILPNKEILSTTKYCTNCGVYVKELKRQLNYYKNKKEEYCKKLYGQKKGSEKIRWKNQQK